MLCFLLTCFFVTVTYSKASSSRRNSHKRSNSGLQRLLDKEEIEQILYELEYNFNDAIVGLINVSDYVSFLEDNLHNTFTSVIDTTTVLDKETFIQANLLFVNEIVDGYHYILQGGLVYKEMTHNYAKVRFNRINISPQKDLETNICRQDFTLEIAFYEFIKQNNQWKVLSVTAPAVHNPLPPQTILECRN